MSARKGQKGFTKRISGYPKGRPKGSLNKTTVMARQLIEGEAEEIIGKLIEQAKDGDFASQKFIVERLLPLARSRTIRIALPNIDTPSDIVKAHDVIWAAVGAGQITLGDAADLHRLLEGKRQAFETADLAAMSEQLKEHMRIGK